MDDRIKYLAILALAMIFICPANSSAIHLKVVRLNKDVEIKGYGLGSNNRIIGEIFVDGKNVNQEMVRTGLAEVYRGKSPGQLDLKPYRKLEIEARNAGRGVWSQGNDYTSPKVWRKMQRKLIQSISRLLFVFPAASHPQ